MNSSEEDCCVPVAKRQKKSQMLCIPCYCVESETFHTIYIVDLSSSHPPNSDSSCFTPLSPTLRIDCETCFKAYSVCVLGSTLYMFLSSVTREAPTDPDFFKTVATVELSDYYNSKSNVVVNLEKDMLSYAPPMLHPKKLPVSTPTPDGRLLVYSSLIRFDTDDDSPAQIDFELYDPRTKSWHPLPGIQDRWDGRRKSSCSSFSIEASCFPSDRVLFVNTEVGMFSLDLDDADTRGWQQVDARDIPPQAGCHSVVDSELCFTDHCAFDIKTSVGSVCCVFPLTSFVAVDKYQMNIASGVTLPWENGFCFVQTAIDKETLFPHMTVHVYTYDLAKYREDKRKSRDGVAQLTTSLSKSFKFLLNAYQCDTFIPLGLFPVSP